MFRRHKKEITKNNIEETKNNVEQTVIKKEIKDVSTTSFPNSVEIKDLELGKTYFRIEVNSNNIDFQKIIIVRKGTELSFNHWGWLLSRQIYNYVVWSEVDTSFCKYKGDLNDLLQENHKDDKHSGPVRDIEFESDYRLNEKVAFFDTTTNLNDIKANIIEFWQKLADKILKEKKEFYDKQLEYDKNDLIKNFNDSLEEVLK